MRHDWTRDEVRALMALPFPALLYQAQTVHRACFDPAEVQVSTLLSIKTGGCPEDCAYCPQSVHHDNGLAAGKLMQVEAVLAEARAARAAGAARVCKGWIGSWPRGARWSRASGSSGSKAASRWGG